MGPKIAALVMFVALTACQSTSGGSFCAIAKPMRFSPEAITAMSDQEVVMRWRTTARVKNSAGGTHERPAERGGRSA